MTIADIDANAGHATAEALGATFFKLDVAVEADWDRLAFSCPAIDIVVNNAGITGFEHGVGPHDPENASLEE